MHALDLAVLQIALDGVFRHASPNLCLGGFGKIPEPARTLVAELCLHLQRILALAAADEPAIPARRAETDPLRLQQDDVHAQLG